MDKRVAIVGFSIRLPHTGVQNFWGDLLQRKDLVTQVDPQRWSQESYLHPDKSHPGTSYTFKAGSIGDISGFDAGFFGISPREASLMDPQQRLLLELAWESMENAGIAPSSLRGSDCGVFIGISSSDYAYRLADDLSVIDAFTATGNTSSIAANRISYLFDLHGPSFSIDTACSSSLVAFHQACRSILSGETSQAITGGVSLHLHPYGFLCFSKATMLSQKGRCQVFDEAGDGYVRSEGGGVFLLKDYDQAINDGDPILAIVAGSAVNADGDKSGMTVPNPKAQAELMTRAYAAAGISPDEIDYLEAHGTGTSVGDPIETLAIGDAIGRHRKQPLPIGSVKSNVGHLEAASGVAGLAKALLSIQHRQVPATISMKKPNPNIKFEEWNIKVVTETLPLKPEGRLVVGVNSFGFGGANAHVILESPPSTTVNPEATDEKTVPVFLSAREPGALKQAADELASCLKSSPQPALYDLAFTSRFKREQHPHGAVLFADSIDTVCSEFKAFASEDEAAENSRVVTAPRLEQAQGPAFIYSGNGCQWETMGKQLLEQSGTFRSSIEEVDRLFADFTDYSLIDELNGKNGQGRFEQTEIAQPALFALQVGITTLLREQGIMPTVVAGHSVGEVAAAWASGVLSLPEAVEVIYQRSHYQGMTRGDGQMTAVGLGVEEVNPLLEEPRFNRLHLAGSNSSRGVTLAGDPLQLTEFEKLLADRSAFYKRLELDYAFHSPSMDSIETGIREQLAAIQPKVASVPYISTVTGGKLDGPELDAEYWWHNIRKPVLFQQAAQSIIDSGINTFIEIGAHPVLRSYLNDALRDSGREGAVISTLARGKDSLEQINETLARTFLTGVDCDLSHFFPVTGQLIKLPDYPWQREPHWHPLSSESQGLLNRHYEHPLLGYPLKQQALTWESQLDTLRRPWLADHVVGDGIVFPGSGFAEIALAAAHHWDGSPCLEIEELEILAPLLLSDQKSKVLRLSIQEANGNLDLTSRDLAATDQWTPHLKGRIRQHASGLLLRTASPVLPDRKPDFTRDQHQQLTQRVGLDYGPAFRAITHGWREGDSVLGIFAVPDSISADFGEFHLHPALLDCAFQLLFQLLGDELDRHQGIAYVPTRMGRIQFNTEGAPLHSARVRLLSRAPHSITAEFALYDAQGQCVALLQEVRFRAVRLLKSQEQRLHYLDYHLTPAPRVTQNAAATGPTLAGVRQGLLQMRDQLSPTERGQRFCEEVDPLLDSLTTAFIGQALATLSDDQHLLSTAGIEQLRQRSPELSGFIRHILASAEEQGLLDPVVDGWCCNTDSDNQIPAELIWNTLLREYPDYFALIHLTGRLGLHLPALLQGEISAEQLGLNPKRFTELARQIQGQSGQQQLGNALSRVLTEQVDALPEGQRLNILEVGVDHPDYAELICPQIDFRVCDYTLGWLNEEALSSAEKLQERYPLLKTRLLTPDPNDAETTGSTSPYQLVIAPLNLGSLAESRQLLQRTREMMAAGAPIILIGQHPAAWIDFVMGASESWWPEATDKALHSQQASSEQWLSLLKELGYTGAELLELNSETGSGTFLITCSAPAEEVQERLDDSGTEEAIHNWLLLTTDANHETRLAESITKGLKQTGQAVQRLSLTSNSDLQALLMAAGSQGQSVDRIILLAGLGTFENTTASDTLESQVLRCHLTTELIKACEATNTETTCWLLTTGVGSTLPCDQTLNFFAAGESVPADAALWGFGRTLMNETSDYQIRLLDLPARSDEPAVIDALLRELLSPDEEQELVISEAGDRFAPRLRLQAAPEPQQPPATDLAEQTLKLGFQLPGQLRNLRWEAEPRRTPGADEVEVEVMATGLNFRDLMYTLGLLADEAIENGFAGPTLGLEFAGRVTRLGKQVEGLQVGDAVVGFGPASFSNRVLTKPTAIAPIPDGIGFEAAATIPSTFFTVYYALHHLARLQPGEKVLIHGAAGGVGISAIQVAQWIGAEIYATAGSDEKRDFLKLMGVEHIYDSRSLSFAEEILQQTGDGRGVDVVLNSLAGEAINQNLRVLKPFGRFLELGKRDFYENTHIGLRPFRNNLSYFGIDADQVMQECPELTQRLFGEMMQLFQEGILHPLPYTQFRVEQMIESFRFMQQARQIGKVVVTYGDSLKQMSRSIPVTVTGEKPTLQLSTQGSYLVTGGLGGFGLRTAQWLIEKGARHLILISRSGPHSDEARSAIVAMELLGVQIQAAACDVTDKNALQQLLADCGQTMPPLKGIVHAATVIEDGLARNLDEAQIRRVLAPKILGAQHLHELTASQALEFFILFSSATTLLGNPGQSSYIAANHWLEALAASRRSQQLPATCVRWGAIDDVGFLARNEKIKDALQGRMGGDALNSAVALAALEQCILADSPTVGIMELNWPALSRFLPTASTPKFREIAQHGEDREQGESHLDIDQMLKELSHSELLETLVNLLKAELSNILLIAEDKIDTGRSMYEMGLDSLMGVELIVAVESLLGIKVPIMALSETPTLTKLAERLIIQLRGTDQEPENEATSAVRQIAKQHGVLENEETTIHTAIESLQSGETQQRVIH